jgi:hypothetical protein
MSSSSQMNRRTGLVPDEALAPLRRIGMPPALDAGLLRLQVYLTRGSLDREIAAGRDLTSTPALTLRAQQLVDVPMRCKVASELRRVVAYADREAARCRLSAVLVEPAQVRAGRAALLALAERVECSVTASARGVALARELLTDGRGPLFNRDCERTVGEAASAAEQVLTGAGAEDSPAS